MMAGLIVRKNSVRKLFHNNIDNLLTLEYNILYKG